MSAGALEAAGYRGVQTTYRSDQTVVYRAHRIEPARAVILKTLGPNATTARARRRLRHEGMLLKELSGVPGIVQLAAMPSTPVGLALELIDPLGVPLASRVDKPFAFERFIDLGLQLVGAVARLHERGILHGDLSPHNVLLAEAGLLLTDFSLAVRLGSFQASSSMLAGTLGYIAPEQTGRMNRSVDARSDLYSVGALLFEMLAGQPVFPVVDTLSSIHATIARPAPEIRSLRPDIPKPVGRIVDVLLQKMAEDRYQTAQGLLADLRQCAEDFRTRGFVPDLELRVSDRSSEFHLPDRLYGRSAAILEQQGAFRRAQGGSTVVVGVRGPAGIGKTALVRELKRDVATQGGLFAEGKFDALGRDEPYTCLIEALGQLLGELAAQSDTGWRARLTEHLRFVGPALADRLPVLVDLIGPQAPPTATSVSAGRARFHEGMEQLLAGLSSPGEPLVLFLDDVQWADRASLDLLQQVLLGWTRGSLLLVLSWRVEEVTSSSPLAVLLSRLPSGLLQELDVGPIDVAGVTALVRDGFDCSPQEAAVLGGIVHDKTAGNPFFVRSWLTDLHARGVVRFDSSSERWHWDLNRVREAPITPNVVDLLVGQLRELPTETAALLATAACGGATVAAELLLLATHDRTDGAQRLVELIRKGFLLAAADVFVDLRALAESSHSGVEEDAWGSVRFPHDKVQEAAIKLLEPAERKRVHLRLGQLQRQRSDPQRDPFPVVDQLNRSLELLEDPEERLAVAQLNLAAGRRARLSGAFDTALDYVEAGLSLLPGSGWEDHYALAFSLHLEASDAALPVTDRELPRPYAQIALDNARSVLDRVAAQEALIRFDLARYDNHRAVSRGLEAVRWLGVSLPDKPFIPGLVVRLLQTHQRLRRMSNEDLRGLPIDDSPETEAAMRLLMRAATPAYYVSATTVAMILTRLVTLSLDRGVNRYSASGFAAWAFLLTDTFGDVERAEQLGSFARELLDRLDAPELRCRVDTVYLGVVRGRQDSWHSLVEPYLDAYLHGIEHGDLSHASLCAYNYATFAFLAGQPLAVVAERAQAMEQGNERLGQERARLALSLLRQVVANLRGENEDPCVFDGEHITEASFRDHMLGLGDKAALAVMEVYRCAVRLRCGSVAMAVQAADDADAVLRDIPGSPHVPYQKFIGALTRIRAHRERQSGLRKAQRDLRALRRFAATAPSNHEHQVRLVEAELASVHGDNEVALTAYEDALQKAKEQGVWSDASFAATLCLHHLERLGHVRSAVPYYEEARMALQTWGADVLMAPLESSAVAALASQLRDARAPSFVDFDTRALDAAAALKAARAISSQMRLSGLIRSLVETAVETTGANFAALVAPYEGDLRVVAELEGSETTIWERESASSLDESLTRAAGLVRRATTQRSAVRLDNAWEHAELGEAYDRPVSVLCVPLFKGTELQGVLYLENTLATAAFRKDHVELAELLAGQATVSLENARLFEDLRSAYDGQTQLAESFARFVPPQFLDALGKSSVLDVHRGDAVSGEFSVLFADIRDFSARAEGLGPEGTFSFVNRYLQHVEPAIHRYEGFVHQLLGDGIVALFPTAHLAVKGALAMLAGTHALNTQLVHENIAPVKIGCGISSGRLMMGAIGGSTRLDRGIIGDVANVASRVEGMTKLYGTPLLVSGPTRMALVGSGDFRLRLVDRVIPAGKTEILEVFEVLDALDAREAELRQRQRPEWDQALEAWRAGSASARQHFEAVIEMGPDPAAEVYLARLTAGAPTPVTRLQVK